MGISLNEVLPFLLQMVIFQELRKWIFGNDGEALEILKRSEKSPFHETHNLKTQVLGTGPKTRVFILLTF